MAGGCACRAAPTRRSITTGRLGKRKSAFSAIRASRLGSRLFARKLASAASAIWASCSMMRTASRRAASVEDPQDLYEAQLSLFLDPNDPDDRSAGARRWGAGRLDRGSQALADIQDGGRLARSRFRCIRSTARLPMVWYVPPLSPIQSHANAGAIDTVGEIPDVRSLRIPVRYLANLLTAGAEAPVVSALERCWRCAFTIVNGSSARAMVQEVLAQVGLTVAQVEDMHRYLAIANYEDRFVIPTSHREQAEDAYGLRGSCGFSFGNGCDFGPPHSSLFGGKMGRRKLTPVRPVDT